MPYTEEYIKELRKQRKLYLIVNCVQAAIILILVILWLGQRSDLKGLIHQVQEQRYTSALRICEDQNSRRSHTVSVLNREIQKLKDGQRVRAEANKVATIALINALAPHQRCSVIAKRVTQGHAPK